MSRSVPARCRRGHRGLVWELGGERRRRQIAEARMRAHRSVVPAPGLDTTFASARERNHSRLRHSSRNLPLKLSLTPFCHGLPGSMNAVPMPWSTIHFSTARATNSGPFVATQVSGRAALADQPREDLDDARRADPAVNLDRQPRLGELVRDRQALELATVGAGIEHEVDRPDLVGAARRLRPRPARGDALAWPSARELQAGAPPQPPGAASAHRVPIAPQENPDASVPVTRRLRRQRRHPRQHRGVLLRQPRAIAQRRARHRHQRASPPLRHAPARRRHHLLPAGRHAHHFLRRSLSSPRSRGHAPPPASSAARSPARAASAAAHLRAGTRRTASSRWTASAR